MCRVCFPQLCIHFMTSTESSNHADLCLRLTAVVGICGRQAGTVAGFLRVFSFPAPFPEYVSCSLIDSFIDDGDDDDDNSRSTL